MAIFFTIILAFIVLQIYRRILWQPGCIMMILIIMACYVVVDGLMYTIATS